MCDIICSYEKNDENEQSYFIMDRNASFLQFIQFLQSSTIIDHSYSIYHSNILIESEETFKNMLNSLQAGSTLHFLFKNNNKINLLENDQPESFPIEEKKEEPLEFGETIK